MYQGSPLFPIFRALSRERSEIKLVKKNTKKIQKKTPKDFYNHFLNFVTDQIRQSKKHIMMNINSMLQNDLKQTWRVIRNIINAKIIR